MARSMTGFGTAEGSVAGGVLQIDVKTVNHRHFNLQLKVPAVLQPFESLIRDELRKHIDRGHITVLGRWTSEPTRANHLTVDLQRAREAHQVLKALKKALKIKDKISLDLITRQPDVVTSVSTEDSEIEFDDVRAVLERAVDEVVAVRSREGALLSRELRNRFVEVANHLQQVERLAPERLTKERDRLRASVAELIQGHAMPDDRVVQEIAILADKLDVTEEVVRLKTHLTAAHDVLSANGSVGKRLTFLAQEMLREINTIGAKANDAGIAHEVVSMKGALEKIREQLENLE